MEVAKNPPKKVYTLEELKEAPKGLQQRIKKRKGISKYFCLDEDGKTIWLTDYNGDQMVNFIDRNKKKPFFLYWSPEAVHSFNTEVPERLTSRTLVKEKSKRQKLAGAVVSVDDQVGKLLKVLEKNGHRNVFPPMKNIGKLSKTIIG